MQGATQDDDPMYRDTAASRELAETPVKLPDDEGDADHTEETEAASAHEGSPPR